MKAETFEVIDRAVQAGNLDLAAIARTGIHFPNVQRAAQYFSNARLQLRADRVQRRRPGISRGARRRKQRLVRAIGRELILNRSCQLRFMPGRQFAHVGHANGRIGFRAEAAKRAFAQVQRYAAGFRAVRAGQGPGRARGNRSPRVLPVRRINLRPAARLAARRRGSLRIIRGHDARSQTMVENVKHGRRGRGQRSVPE